MKLLGTTAPLRRRRRDPLRRIRVAELRTGRHKRPRTSADRRRRGALAEGDLDEPVAARAQQPGASRACRRSRERGTAGPRGASNGSRRERHDRPPAPGAEAEIPCRGYGAAGRADRGRASAVLRSQCRPLREPARRFRSRRSFSTPSSARTRRRMPRRRSLRSRRRPQRSAATIGDRLLLDAEFRDADEQTVSNMFGADFARGRLRARARRMERTFEIRLRTAPGLGHSDVTAGQAAALRSGSRRGPGGMAARKQRKSQSRTTLRDFARNMGSSSMTA